MNLYDEVDLTEINNSITKIDPPDIDVSNLEIRRDVAPLATTREIIDAKKPPKAAPTGLSKLWKVPMAYISEAAQTLRQNVVGAFTDVEPKNGVKSFSDYIDQSNMRATKIEGNPLMESFSEIAKSVQEVTGAVYVSSYALFNNTLASFYSFVDRNYIDKSTANPKRDFFEKEAKQKRLAVQAIAKKAVEAEVYSPGNVVEDVIQIEKPEAYYGVSFVKTRNSQTGKDTIHRIYTNELADFVSRIESDGNNKVTQIDIREKPAVTIGGYRFELDNVSKGLGMTADVVDPIGNLAFGGIGKGIKYGLGGLGKATSALVSNPKVVNAADTFKSISNVLDEKVANGAVSRIIDSLEGFHTSTWNPIGKLAIRPLTRKVKEMYYPALKMGKASQEIIKEQFEALSVVLNGTDKELIKQTRRYLSGNMSDEDVQLYRNWLQTHYIDPDVMPQVISAVADMKPEQRKLYQKAVLDYVNGEIAFDDISAYLAKDPNNSVTDLFDELQEFTETARRGKTPAYVKSDGTPSKTKIANKNILTQVDVNDIQAGKVRTNLTIDDMTKWRNFYRDEIKANFGASDQVLDAMVNAVRMGDWKMINQNTADLMLDLQNLIKSGKPPIDFVPSQNDIDRVLYQLKSNIFAKEELRDMAIAANKIFDSMIENGTSPSFVRELRQRTINAISKQSRYSKGAKEALERIGTEEEILAIPNTIRVGKMPSKGFSRPFDIANKMDIYPDEQITQLLGDIGQLGDKAFINYIETIAQYETGIQKAKTIFEKELAGKTRNTLLQVMDELGFSPTVLKSAADEVIKLDDSFGEILEAIGRITPEQRAFYKGRHLRRSYNFDDAEKAIEALMKTDPIKGGKLRQEFSKIRAQAQVFADNEYSIVGNALGKSRSKLTPEMRQMLMPFENISDALVMAGKAVAREVGQATTTKALYQTGKDILWSNTPDTVKTILLPDTAGYGDLAGKWVSKPLYERIKKVIEQGDAVSDILHDTVSWYKAILVPNSPMSRLRNTISNFAALSLGTESYSITDLADSLAKAWKSMHDRDELFQIASKYTDSFSRASITNEIGKLAEAAHNGNILTKALFNNPLAKSMRYEEPWFKMAFVHRALDSGLTDDVQEAVLLAEKWLVDYSDVPAWLNFMRSKVAITPFLTWSVKMFPNMIKTPVKNFEFYAKFGKNLNAYNDLFDSEKLSVERDSMPEWFKDQTMVRLPGVKSLYVNLDTYFPWGLFSQFTNIANDDISFTEVTTDVASYLANQIGFIYKPIIGLAANRDTYTGREIWREDDLPDEVAQKRIDYLQRNLPGFYTFDQLTKVITAGVSDDPEKMSLVQAMTRAYNLEPDKNTQFEYKKSQMYYNTLLGKKENTFFDPNMSIEAKERKLRLIQQELDKTKVDMDRLSNRLYRIRNLDSMFYEATGDLEGSKQFAEWMSYYNILQPDEDLKRYVYSLGEQTNFDLEQMYILHKNGNLPNQNNSVIISNNEGNVEEESNTLDNLIPNDPLIQTPTGNTNPSL